jgi:hypothetical protein
MIVEIEETVIELGGHRPSYGDRWGAPSRPECQTSDI